MLAEGWPGLNTVMKLKKNSTNIPPPLKKTPTKQSKAKQRQAKPSQAKQHSPPPPPHPKIKTFKRLLLRSLWHSSHLFSSNKALNAVVLCPVLATAVGKTYEPVVDNAEYNNENDDFLFIAKKGYSWKQFFEDYCSCKIRKLFFIQIPWTIKRRKYWQVIIDIIIMSNKLDISKSLLLEFFWKYWEPSFENHLGITAP